MNKPLEDHTVPELLAVYALSGFTGNGLKVSVDVYEELERRIESSSTPKPISEMTFNELSIKYGRLHNEIGIVICEMSSARHFRETPA